MQCLVIGAGVVGLAIARTLAQRGHEVIVSETEDAIGTGVSSRNSEGSMPASTTRPAPRALTASPGAGGSTPSARATGLPHARCGKLVVCHDR